MSEKLKACDICGGETIPFSAVGEEWEIVCKSNPDHRGQKAETREAAIKAWNKRKE